MSVTAHTTILFKQKINYDYKRAVYSIAVKKTPRCRVNEMIKPNGIRWAVLFAVV
jgi:hypothetical protein